MQEFRARIEHDLKRYYNDDEMYNKERIEEYVIGFLKNIIKQYTHKKLKIEAFKASKGNLELWYFYRLALKTFSTVNHSNEEELMQVIIESMVNHYDSLIANIFKQKMEADINQRNQEMNSKGFISLVLGIEVISTLLNTSSLLMASLLYGYIGTEESEEAAQVIQEVFTEFLERIENEGSTKNYIMTY